MDPAASPVLSAVVAHYDELKRYVQRKVRSADLAAEIIHDTYLRLAAVAGTTRIEDPRAFLFRAARNLAIDRLRTTGARAQYMYRGPLPEQAPAPESLPDARASARERLGHVAATVAQLPPRSREVFVLRVVEDLDHAEIARRLGITRNMVERHLRKALLFLLVRLEEPDPVPRRSSPEEDIRRVE